LQVLPPILEWLVRRDFRGEQCADSTRRHCPKTRSPTLTLVVSLESIFLSTFIMIGQNRSSAFQQEKADHDFLEQETELKSNTELTRKIHKLTTELHRRVIGQG
jgi:hypothetical protein